MLGALATSLLPNLIAQAVTVPATAPATAPAVLDPTARAAAVDAILNAPAASPLLPPVLILVLCVVAGVGTVMLLPSRRETALRKIGGIVLLAAGLILAALLVRAAGRYVQGGMGVYFWLFSAVAIAGAVRVITHPRPVYSALYFVLSVFATAGLFVLMWAEFMAVALVIIYAGAILVTYVFVIMLAAEAAPAGSDGAAGALAAVAEHDAVSREPLIASAVGFALMGVLLFVIFDRAEGFRLETPARYAGSQAIDGGFRTANANLSDEFQKMSLASPASAAERDVMAEAPTTVPSDTGLTASTRQDPIQQLGTYLFTHQHVNLELAGLILTVAMVGAIVIARRRVVNPAGVGPGGAGATTGVPGETVTGPATPVDDNPHSIPVYGTENPRQKAYPET